MTRDGLRACTTSTITDLYRLRRELQDVRERVWAIDREELMEGVVSLAAPIEDRRGLTVGAIAIAHRKGGEQHGPPAEGQP